MAVGGSRSLSVFAVVTATSKLTGYSNKGQVFAHVLSKLHHGQAVGQFHMGRGASWHRRGASTLEEMCNSLKNVHSIGQCIL